jgi:hypothetical protein
MFSKKWSIIVEDQLVVLKAYTDTHYVTPIASNFKTTTDAMQQAPPNGGSYIEKKGIVIDQNLT